MDINNEANEISFKLNQAVKNVTINGKLMDAETIRFRQPTRKTAPYFQKLSAMFGSAVKEETTKVLNTFDDYDKGKVQSQAEEAKNEEVNTMDSLPKTTGEELEVELEFLEGMIIPTMDFDYEKADKLFEKVLMGGKHVSEICFLGGQGLTETNLDKIHYQDLQKMLVVYITFFGKPVKSGTKTVSEQPSELATSATAV